MKKRTLIAVLVALSAAHAGAAQLYRWVDEKGNVEWRDTPPPAHAKNVERRNVSGNTIETSTLPYAVQQAVKNHPVTLWTYECGDPCSKAAAHLARRGIPHTVRYSNKEPETLKKLTGGTEVPILFVGSQQLRGYLESAWDTALDAAGYPKTPPPGMKSQAAKRPPAATPTSAASK